MTKQSSDPSSGQLALALAQQDKASFSNFLTGDNTELTDALQTLVQKRESKVVFIYGPEGSGKSHLLFACMRLARDENFPSSYQSLTDSRVTPEMLRVIDPTNLVCIDNIHAWAGDANKERALFTLFEQIKHGGGQLIVSAAQPADLNGFVIPDLVSRLSSGLIYPLRELTDEQTLLALKLRAEQRGLSIADDVLRYLLSRATRDTTVIFEILDRIDRASLAEQRRVTIPFIQQLLSRHSVFDKP
ncbi:DnaA regulatory inactivator Hda [Arenicella xantha]|uniref:Regulatory inactivation of DnaA Hda protein n=1 Tax=Arenicella xantha TaxID=644221 RepID=A0A395JS89_9GAMM|nr:DnaA regulatory inactivator Hda [Arenicella xantha]RBP51550.1 regulatory inactivation of DnaA Hda protein [Arenicella xantha]